MKKFLKLICFLALPLTCTDIHTPRLICDEEPFSINEYACQPSKKIIFQFKNEHSFFVENDVSENLCGNAECIISKAFLAAPNSSEITLSIPFDITTVKFLPPIIKGLPTGKELTKITKIINDESYNYNQKINIIYEIEKFFRYLQGFDHIVWFLCTHALVQPHLLISTDLYPENEKDFENLIARTQSEIARQKPLNTAIEEILLRQSLIQKLNNSLAISRQYGLQQFEKKLYSQMMKTRNPLILDAIFHLHLPCQDANARLSFLEYAFNKLRKLYNFNEIMQFYLSCKPPLAATSITLQTRKNRWNLDECITIFKLYQTNTRMAQEFQSFFTQPINVRKIEFTQLKTQDRMVDPEQIIEKLSNH